MLQGHRWDKRECPIERSRPGEPSPLPSRISGQRSQIQFSESNPGDGDFCVKPLSCTAVATDPSEAGRRVKLLLQGTLHSSSRARSVTRKQVRLPVSPA